MRGGLVSGKVAHKACHDDSRWEGLREMGEIKNQRTPPHTLPDVHTEAGLYPACSTRLQAKWTEVANAQSEEGEEGAGEEKGPGGNKAGSVSLPGT